MDDALSNQVYLLHRGANEMPQNPIKSYKMTRIILTSGTTFRYRMFSGAGGYSDYVPSIRSNAANLHPGAPFAEVESG